MKSYQLDECLNAKKLANECNSSERCEVRRFPDRLKKQKDHIVLPDLLSKDAPLLTNDFTIFRDNWQHIPVVNSGLIVVKSNSPREPFTSKKASLNILRLKQKFPKWAETDWAGIYLEIDEEEVFIALLKREPRPSLGLIIPIDQKGFSETLEMHLNMLKTSSPSPIGVPVPEI